MTQLMIAMSRAFSMRSPVMPKRQSRTLLNPKLIFNDRQAVPILELNISQFPQDLKLDWLPCIIEPTRIWLKQSSYRGRGTLWEISNPSLNFGQEWVESISVIAQGFKEDYFNCIYEKIKYELGDLVNCIEYIVPCRDRGWSPLLFVSGGKTWVPFEGEVWIQI